MKQTNIRLLQQFFVAQINFLVFYPFSLTLVTLFNGVIPSHCPRVLIWILGGLLPFGFYILRQKFNYFIPLVIMHMVGVGIIVGLSFLLSSNPINRGYFILVGVGFAFYSIYIRLKVETFEYNTVSMPFAVLFIAGGLFLQHYQKNTEWDLYYKIVIILILAFYFFQYYLNQYLTFLTVNSSSSGVLPEKEIFSSGMGLSILYTMLVAFILLATAQFSWLKGILNTIGQVLLGVIRFIFSLFPERKPNIAEVTLEKQVPAQNNSMILPDGGETALIWKILEIAALIGLIILIVVGFLVAIKRLIAFLRKMMPKGGLQPKEINSLVAVDVREKCEIVRKYKNAKKNREFFGFLDSGMKIRRIYKKRAETYKPNPLMLQNSAPKKFSTDRLSFYTAREIARYMDMNAFAEIYEKARYSQTPCTSQDVKRMKELCSISQKERGFQ